MYAESFSPLHAIVLNDPDSEVNTPLRGVALNEMYATDLRQ